MKLATTLFLLLAAVISANAQTGYTDGVLSIRDVRTAMGTSVSDFGILAALSNESDSINGNFDSYSPTFYHTTSGVVGADFTAPSAYTSSGIGVDDGVSYYGGHASVPFFSNWATSHNYDAVTEGTDGLPPTGRAGGSSYFSIQIAFGENADHAVVNGLYFERLVEKTDLLGETTTYGTPNDTVYVWIDGAQVFEVTPLLMDTALQPFYNAATDTDPSGTALYAYYWADFSLYTNSFENLQNKTLTVDLYSYEATENLSLAYDDIALIGSASPPVVVPEAGSALLASLGVLLILRRRR